MPPQLVCWPPCRPPCSYLGGWIDDVLDQELYTRDPALTGWNQGGCLRCKFVFNSRTTPTVTGVLPRIVGAGDVISVSGDTLISDGYHTAIGHTHRRIVPALKKFERVFLTSRHINSTG